MRNFKKVVAMTLVATSTLSLAACGSSNSDASSDNGKKKITIAWWGSDDRNAATQTAIENFEAAHTDIEVELQPKAWEGYEEMISTKFSSNSQADINQINWSWLTQYDSQDNLFLDLNTVSDTLDLSQFDTTYLDLCKVGDTQAAVPVSVTGRIFYWNQAMFDKAGISTPTTYDELIAAGQKFKEVLGDDYYPLALNELDRTILMVYYLESKYSKEWVKDGALNFTQDEIAEGYKFITTLEENHVIPTMETLLGDGASTLDANSKWINGNYAGIFEWDSSASKYQKALADEYQSSFVVGDEIKFGSSNGGYSKISLAFAISKNTDYPTECAQLLEYLLNDTEGVTTMGLQRGTPLSQKAYDTLDAAGTLKGDMVTEANGKVTDFVEYSMDPTFEDSTLKSSTGIYYTNMQYVSYGQLSPEDAAAELMTAVNEVLSKY